MLIHSDPNNTNSIVYHLTIVRYSMKTLHRYFPWATALYLYNMTGRDEKLQQLHCYHPFLSKSVDIYLTKNHYENYSPKMVAIAKIWGSGSWTITTWMSPSEVEEKVYKPEEYYDIHCEIDVHFRCLIVLLLYNYYATSYIILCP